jgi:hypothetical protein
MVFRVLLLRLEEDHPQITQISLRKGAASVREFESGYKRNNFLFSCQDYYANGVRQFQPRVASTLG